MARLSFISGLPRSGSTMQLTVTDVSAGHSEFRVHLQTDGDLPTLIRRRVHGIRSMPHGATSARKMRSGLGRVIQIDRAAGLKHAHKCIQPAASNLEIQLICRWNGPSSGTI